jgi:cellulose synthase/poly-beta-1,6-N-acetylglucosamine synthase-like glycosyltransferase
MDRPPNPSHSPYEYPTLTGIPTVSLEPDPMLPTGDPVNHAAAQLLPEQVCRYFRMIPMSYEDGLLTLAMADPSDPMAQNVAYALTNDAIQMVLAPPNQIDRAIDRVWGGLGHFEPFEGQMDEAAALEIAASEEGVSIASPGRLGDILIQRGLITEDELRIALERQEQTGSRLGEILYYEMRLGEEDLAAALADQLRVPLVDLDGVDPDPTALDVIPEALQREGRCVPLAIDDTALYIAITDPLDDETYEAIRELTDLRIRTYMVTRSDLEALLREIHLEEHVRAARTELLTRFPEDCANRVLSTGQRIFFIAFLVAVLIGFVLAPLLTAIILVIICVTIYTFASLYKFKLFYDSFGRRREFDFTPEEVAAVDDRELPRYTILVPLFREAAVVPRLTENLTRLDYPKSKLEIMLLCEEEDDETIEAILDSNLPPYFRILIVPDSQPKTKPKACNYGIQQATGKFVVIYDAEDQPDPDQLKKVLLAWERSEDNVVCVQSKLNYFNTEQNLLTRFFATEYALWFDLLLPGLDASGAPIPLGGTSNHFNREALVELGAWDPFNVTEDADLGLRLHKAGYRTVMLNSTTLEEANSQLGNWINQRSRWVKGYFQTYLVHMRHPFRLMREIGFGAFWSFQFIIGGTIIFVLNPIFWLLTTLWLFTQAGLIEEMFPGFIFYVASLQLFVGNFVFMYLAVAGSMQRGLFHLVRYALFSPIYWGLMSLGAWKGFYQLFTKPFYWEKTEHGLDAGHTPAKN